MSTVLPPREVFETVLEPSVNGENFSNFIQGKGRENYIKTVCPPEGGMYMYFADEPYPYPTHPYVNAAKVNAIVKKQTLLLFQPFTKIFSPTKFLENYLSLYCKMATSIYFSVPPDEDGRIRIPYLKEQYYDPLCREIWLFLRHFLVNLGITEQTANQFGKNIATVLQYDNAYREPLRDIFSETSKEKISRREIIRLMSIVRERAKDFEIDKFISIAKIVSWSLWIPKVNRAFYKALKESDFKNFQHTEISSYNALSRTDYDYFGLSSEIRQSQYKKRRSDLSLNN
jgi:hypothetical protein